MMIPFERPNAHGADPSMPIRILALTLLALVTTFPAIGQEPATVPDAELLDELSDPPADNVERVARLVELYKQAGAPEESIALQKVAGRGPDDPELQNVVITKPGKSEAVIVVGGHLDKVMPGRGVIDDWSGASMASNLYQAIREVPTEHTFDFLGFAYEEQGLVGSNLFVEELGEAGVDRTRAMVNLECLGVGGPFLWTNGSTDALEAIAHHAAVEAGLDLTDHLIPGVGADSIPFDRAGVPTITFDGLPTDRFALIHSESDQFEAIDGPTYANSYAVALRFLLELDRTPDLGALDRANEDAIPDRRNPR